MSLATLDTHEAIKDLRLAGFTIGFQTIVIVGGVFALPKFLKP